MQNRVTHRQRNTQSMRVAGRPRARDKHAKDDRTHTSNSEKHTCARKSQARSRSPSTRRVVAREKARLVAARTVRDRDRDAAEDRELACLGRSTRWSRRHHCAHNNRQGGLAAIKAQRRHMHNGAGKCDAGSRPIKIFRVPVATRSAHTA